MEICSITTTTTTTATKFVVAVVIVLQVRCPFFNFWVPPEQHIEYIYLVTTHNNRKTRCHINGQSKIIKTIHPFDQLQSLSAACTTLNGLWSLAGVLGAGGG